METSTSARIKSDRTMECLDQGAGKKNGRDIFKRHQGKRKRAKGKKCGGDKLREVTNHYAVGKLTGDETLHRVYTKIWGSFVTRDNGYRPPTRKWCPCPRGRDSSQCCSSRIKCLTNSGGNSQVRAVAMGDHQSSFLEGNGDLAKRRDRSGFSGTRVSTTGRGRYKSRPNRGGSSLFSVFDKNEAWVGKKDGEAVL